MKTRLQFILLALAFLFGAKVFGQEWEYVRIYDSYDSIRPNCMQSLTEFESGDIVVNASWRNNNVNGNYSENPGLMKFSSDGVLQKEVYWSRFGYRSDDQYIIESPDHNIIVMGHFLPDRDPDCTNFVLEYSDKAYLYFYKMDSNLNMIDSIEYLIPLDTTNNAAFYQAGTSQIPNISMAKIKLTSAFVEDGHIVGSYTKTQTRYQNYALDSLFFFKMDFDGNLLMHKGISLGDRGLLLLLSYCHELDNKNINHYILTKFPAEAFVGIDEAHDNGLKVAIAYPNPGGNTLNIRTAVTMWQPYKAHVEVYDMNGRLIHSQALTENMTAINTENWPSGVYVWRVMMGTELVGTELVEVPTDSATRCNRLLLSKNRWGTELVEVPTDLGTTHSTTLVETGKWVKE